MFGRKDKINREVCYLEVMPAQLPWQIKIKEILRHSSLTPQILLNSRISLRNHKKKKDRVGLHLLVPNTTLQSAPHGNNMGTFGVRNISIKQLITDMGAYVCLGLFSQLCSSPPREESGGNR